MQIPRSSPNAQAAGSHKPADNQTTELIAAMVKNRLLLVGSIMVALLVLVAIFAPLVAPYSPYDIGLGPSNGPPTREHIMGTDKLGRDLFSRIIYGARTALMVSLPSVTLAVMAGLVLGLVAGYFGGRTDEIIMRILDVFFAFPGLLLAIAVVAVLGPSIPNLILTIALLYTPRMARIVRGPVLSIKATEFIFAAHVSGAKSARIINRHIMPNALSPIIVETTLSASRAIITVSALAYLGLGAPPPSPSWGEMLSTSRQFMSSAPWSSLFPGMAIVYATTAFILLGNGLRDFLDPRRRHQQ